MKSATQLRMFDLVYTPSSRELFQRGERISLSKLSHALFDVLIEHAPAVVSYDTIAEQVWCGKYVSPETMGQRVKLLRDALGDKADDPRYVKVIRGVGIKWIPTVELNSIKQNQVRRVTDQSFDLQPSAARVNTKKITLLVAVMLVSAIAFVYFKILSGHAHLDLKHIRSITFIPFSKPDHGAETSLFTEWLYFKTLQMLSDIEALDVTDYRELRPLLRDVWSKESLYIDLRQQALLTGEFELADGVVMTTITLIDNVTRETIWVKVYKLSFEQLASLPGLIVQDLAVALNANEGTREVDFQNKMETHSMPALLAYMRSGKLNNAIDQVRLMDEAISYDPGYLQAYARRALARSWSLLESESRHPLSRTQLSNLKSQILHDIKQVQNGHADLFEAHLALAIVKTLSWQWIEADQHFSSAVGEHDNSVRASAAMALFMVATERSARAIAALNNAIELYPDWVSLQILLGRVYLLSGDPFSALQKAKEAHQMDPENPMGLRNLMLTYLMLGEIERARFYRDEVASHYEAGTNSTVFSLLAYISGKLGDKEMALHFFDRVKSVDRLDNRDVGASSWVLSYLAIGDTESALFWMTKATSRAEQNRLDLGFFNLYLLKINQLRDPVLDQHDFLSLRARLGYATETTIGVEKPSKKP